MFNQFLYSFFLHQINGATSKAPSHHSGAQYFGIVLHCVYQEIEFCTTYFVMFAEALVTLKHFFTEGSDIALFQILASRLQAQIFIYYIFATTIYKVIFGRYIFTELVDTN